MLTLANTDRKGGLNPLQEHNPQPHACNFHFNLQVEKIDNLRVKCLSTLLINKLCG